MIHTGDQFVNGRFPFVDFASGGDVEGYIKTVGNVLAQCDDQTKIIPGHGVLATKADLKKFHDMLTATSSLVSFIQHMKIRDLLWLPEIVDKLEWKHGVKVYEVEQLFDNRPGIRFVEKGQRKGENVYLA